jgi:hypothetical protein
MQNGAAMSELQRLLDRIEDHGAYEALFCFQLDTDAINAEATQAGRRPVFAVSQSTPGQRTITIFAPDDAGQAIIWPAEESELRPHSLGKLRRTIQRLNDWKQALTATKAQGNSAPKGRPGRPKRSRDEVNLEALTYLQSNRESMGWSQRSWAKHLRCSTGMVAKCSFWKEIMNTRAGAKEDRRERS